MLRPEHLLRILADAGLCVPTVDGFAHAFPADTKRGIAVFDGFDQGDYDYELRGLHKLSLQVVARSPRWVEARDMGEDAAVALHREDGWRTLNSIAGDGIPPVAVWRLRLARPPSLFRRGDGNLVESALNIQAVCLSGPSDLGKITSQ